MQETLDNLVERYPQLAESREDIVSAFGLLCGCFQNGGKLLVAGNGGSAADADHIVGELMKGFRMKRPLADEDKASLVAADALMGGKLAATLQGALPAISLSAHTALMTAFGNDCDPALAFAQQVKGYGRRGDVLMAISTSGNSGNILYAAVAAKAAGMKVIGLSGKGGGRLSEIADVCICVPETECFKVQELHLPVYHALCLMLESRFFKE